jgi:hypothetical protein
MFWDNLPVPSAGVKNKMEPIGCLETSVRNYRYCTVITQMSAVHKVMAESDCFGAQDKIILKEVLGTDKESVKM